MKYETFRIAFAAALAVACSLPAPAVLAHCDSIDGPVVVDARAALAAGSVAKVLKWVSAARESEVQESFGKTLAVRQLGTEAQQLADNSFFETLVRLHRETEGAPYNGLKPAGKQSMVVRKLDGALDSGSVDEFAAMVAEHTASGIKTRFLKAHEAKKKAEATPAEGRAYVAAYVDLMHFTEAVVAAVHSEGGHSHETPGDKAAAHAHD